MKILIISGAGFFAGNSFYMKFIKMVAKSFKFKDDSSFPEVILYNYPFKSIDYKGNINQELAKQEIESILQQVGNVDKLVIACNTLHLLNLDKKGIVSLPKLLNEELDTWGDGNALILCSENSIKSGLFFHPLILYPEEHIIHATNSMIQDFLLDNPLNFKNIQLVKEYVAQQNISKLVIACTELSMLSWKDYVSIPVVDTVDLVIASLIKDLRKEYESL